MVSPRDELGERVGMTWEPQPLGKGREAEGFISIDDLVVGTVMQMSSGVVVGYAMGERLGSFGEVQRARESVIQRVTRRISGEDESILLALTRRQGQVVLEVMISALKLVEQKSMLDLAGRANLADDMRKVISALEARGLERTER